MKVSRISATGTSADGVNAWVDEHNGRLSTQFVVAAAQLDAERVADHAQVAVGRAEQREFLVRLFEGDIEIHSVGDDLRSIWFY